ncbi:MAG: cobalt-precorrin 5A hydrolase, partial [Firmicutes bacterium]|nr:cobalt-precorrin 5A hydrolase [Bacillota bacterium]
MKTALFCLTAGGYALARQIQQGLTAAGDQTDLYAPERDFILPGQAETFKSLARAVETAFSSHRRLIMIMALGIAVRMIAPHLKDKNTDPAVVVLDEAGAHVISVLSGHLGGANELTRQIAALTGARPVITTATDVHGLPAVDDLARIYDLALDPASTAKIINTALVNGGSVCFYVPREMRQTPATDQVQYRSPGDYPQQPADTQYHVVVTNRLAEQTEANTFYLRPRNLVAGVGCRKGADPDSILTALHEALALCKRSPLSLRTLATIDIKEQEPGLRQVMAKLQLPLAVFSPAQINHFLHRQG